MQISLPKTVITLLSSKTRISSITSNESMMIFKIPRAQKDLDSWVRVSLAVVEELQVTMRKRTVRNHACIAIRICSFSNTTFKILRSRLFQGVAFLNSTKMIELSTSHFQSASKGSQRIRVSQVMVKEERESIMTTRSCFSQTHSSLPNNTSVTMKKWASRYSAWTKLTSRFITNLLNTRTNMTYRRQNAFYT